MSIQNLPRASGFNPGSEIWLVAPFEESTWTAKVDWYLNFQMSRSLKKVAKALPEEIVEIERLTELDLPKPPPSSPYPLLVSSLDLLPNKWVVVYPPQLDAEALCLFTQNMHSRFEKSTLRLFLPKGLTPSSFALAWEKAGANVDISVVTDTQ